jgi:hypothetical protein
MNPFALLRLLAAGVIITACSMDDEDRRDILKSAEQTNYQIVRGTVVRDLTAPTDTGRLIYDPPQSLSEGAARAIGNEQVWAPFGIGTPDSAQGGSRREFRRYD